ncbi:MAG: hypothetical protein U9Q92_04075 [archaeon]|nr:hypothetical protein [archaeon]
MEMPYSAEIKLPEIVHLGDKPVEDLDWREIELLNARLYTLAKNEYITTLNEGIIIPFREAFRKKAVSEAKERGGADTKGIVRKYEFSEVFDDMKFVLNLPAHRTHYEVVSSRFKDILEDIIYDSGIGVGREEVISVNKSPYASVDYLIAQMKRLRKEKTTRYNDGKLIIKSSETDDYLPLDEEIEEMTVYFDGNHSRVNYITAHEYYEARSLRERIGNYLGRSKGRLIRKFDIPERLEESISLPINVGDTAIRYLFFCQPSAEYGEICSGLEGKETKNITGNTGDLNILRELAFEENPDEYIWRKEELNVNTQPADGNYEMGKTTISRQHEDNWEQRAYSVLREGNKIYVSISDVSDILRMLTQEHTSHPTRLKINFFPAHSAYLRQS